MKKINPAMAPVPSQFVEEIQELAKNAARRDRPVKKIYHGAALIFGSMAFAISFGKHSPRLLDPDGIITEAIEEGAKRGFEAASRRQTYRRDVRTSALNGTLITDHPEWSSKDVMDALLVLGVPERDVEEAYDRIERIILQKQAAKEQVREALKDTPSAFTEVSVASPA